MRTAKPFVFNKTLPDGGLADWVTAELNQYLRDLSTILNRGLNPAKNFLVFEDTFDCASGAEVSISNKLTQIPNEWTVIDAQDGGPLVRGTTEWTASTLYLANIGPSGSFKVRFSFTGTR